MTTLATPDELRSRISACATARGGSARTPDERTVEGTLTAIKSQWFLGGRMVKNSFRCHLDANTRTVRFRETAAETSWGLPPPALTVQASRQFGSRVNTSRTEKAVGGGGRLEFGQFREDIEKAASDGGWSVVDELV